MKRFKYVLYVVYNMLLQPIQRAQYIIYNAI